MNKYWFYKVGLVVVFLCFALLGGAKVKLPGRTFYINEYEKQKMTNLSILWRIQ